MTREPLVIVGAGMCGLGAGQSGALLFEASGLPGGVCHSYYMDLEGRQSGRSETAFRFEPAGGHWLFDASPSTLAIFERVTPMQWHERKAAIYFATTDTFVPYPIQDNLHALPEAVRARVLEELSVPCGDMWAGSFKEWLIAAFGQTLGDLFFLPFNERYTAGLLDRIAPQDLHKSPLDMERVRRGAVQPVPAGGYNPMFLYPPAGLDVLTQGLARGCNIATNHRLIGVDSRTRTLHFENGHAQAYERVLSTIPLQTLARICQPGVSACMDLSTVVAVANIGALRGAACPKYHWLYLPHSRSGMHRVGFYSEVGASFVPQQRTDQYVAVYAETAFVSGAAPGPAEQDALLRAVITELKDLGFIGDVRAAGVSVTDPAYTWRAIGSNWAAATREALAEHALAGGRNARQAGRPGGRSRLARRSSGAVPTTRWKRLRGGQIQREAPMAPAQGD